MGNQVTILTEINNIIQGIENNLKSVNQEILRISRTSRDVSSNFSNVNVPSDVSSRIKATATSTEQLNIQLKEQDRLERALITQQTRLTQATESTNRALIQARTETNQQNALLREAAVINSRLSTELQRAVAQRNRLARTIQDLNVRQELGNRLSREEQDLLRRSRTEFQRYDRAVRRAREGVGRFQDSVGNYNTIGGSALNLTRQLVGAFGLLEAARIGISFAADSARIAREARGVQFAFRRLGDEGQRAFEDIREATRGALSDLEIQRSLNEFRNLGIQLDTSAVAFEFLAVRAAQTGRSIASLREDLVTGLGRGSVRILDNLGLSMSELNELTEQQGLSIQEAFGVVAQREIRAAGTILDDGANSQERFNAALENFRVTVGSGFIGRFIDDLNDLGTSLINTLSNVNTVSNSFSTFFLNLARVARGQADLVAAEAAIRREQQARIPIVEEIINLQRQQGTIEVQLNQNRDRLIRINTVELRRILDRLKAQLGLNEVTRNATTATDNLTKSTERRNRVDSISLRTTEERIDAERRLAQQLLEVIQNENQEDASFELPEIDQESIDAFQQRIQEALNRDRILGDLNEGVREATDSLFEEIENFSGLSSATLRRLFEQIKDDGIDSFQDIAQAAVTAFDAIGQISSTLSRRRLEALDREIEANDAYYEDLLDNEELTESERTRLEADREAREEQLRQRQRQEQTRQARIEKAFNIATIIANTAVGVSKALAQGGFVLGIPFAGVIAALGAAQLAVAVATPIPQFAEGGVMDHDGAMMINDHPSGRLEVVERDGKFLMTDKKNAIVEGKKGDIIHKDANKLLGLDANKYFSSLSDDQLLSDLTKHTVIANMQKQNHLADMYIANQMIINNQDRQTSKIVKAINSKKTRFNVTNNVSLGKDLKFINRKNNVL